MLNSMCPFIGRRYVATTCTSAAVMCRASARGCTVIPGAPDSTQILTASSTDGTDPPRELRTVATLLTLTESFAKSQIPNPKFQIPKTLGLGIRELVIGILHSQIGRAHV